MSGKIKNKIPLPSQRNMPTVHQVKEQLNNLRSHLNTQIKNPNNMDAQNNISHLNSQSSFNNKVSPRIEQGVILPFNQPLPGMMNHNVFKREASVHTNDYKATTDIKDFRSRSRIHF